MSIFWQKPIFWIVCFTLTAITIPVLFFYLSKHSIFPTSNTINQSKSPTIVKSGSCQILESKYCSQGQLINTKNQLGQPETYIGFSLPEDVPISAGRDGQVLRAIIGQPSEIQGLMAVVLDPNTNNATAPIYDIRGDLRMDDMSTRNVKKGDVIGYTKNTGIKNFGKYNLIFTIRRLDPKNKMILTDKQLLNELFSQVNNEK